MQVSSRQLAADRGHRATVDGVEYLLLVRDHDGRRWHLGYDIRELETLETGVMARFLASALFIIRCIASSAG